jgi:L-alanine-DL-glutamate epimerase-like enolase superfamily enzyme
LTGQPAARISEVTLYRVRIPLHVPYNTALGVFAELDTIVAEVRDDEGRRGFGETTIIPGYTEETVDGGWAFCREHAARLLGMDAMAARALLAPHRAAHSHAVSVLQVALEMMEGAPLLSPPARETRVPILAPVNGKDLRKLPDEIEGLLRQGFRTLKIKVGWEPEADARRVALIQKVNAGRALLRMDANQGYDRARAEHFVSLIDPASLQLFEQPCAADDWESNAAVAAVSPVPVMMDESIYGLADIDRAGAMRGCGFVKLKISKMTGVELLRQGLEHVRARGMQPIVGNGAASDIGCWIESCVAAVTTEHAGEMHGFLKNTAQLMKPSLSFADGAVVLPAGFRPEPDRAVLSSLATATERFAPTTVDIR